MLDYFIKKAHSQMFPLLEPRPRVVVGIPSGVTEVERAQFMTCISAARASCP